MMPKIWQNQTNGRSCRKTRIFCRYCLPPYHRHQCRVSLHCSSYISVLDIPTKGYLHCGLHISSFWLLKHTKKHANTNYMVLIKLRWHSTPMSTENKC
jgi:hypothetical protein